MSVRWTGVRPSWIHHEVSCGICVNRCSSADDPSGIGYRRGSANGDPFTGGFAAVQTSPVVCSGVCHDANGAERLACPPA